MTPARALIIYQLHGLREWIDRELREAYNLSPSGLRRLIRRFDRPRTAKMTTLPRRRMARTGARQLGTKLGCLPCGVCGGPVAQRPGKEAKSYHDNCREFRKHQLAMRRHLGKIEWQQTKDGLRAAKITRGDMLADVNIIPVDWHSLRGAGGRFRPKTQREELKQWRGRD